MEPFSVELDDIVSSLAAQIANSARTIAMLEGQVAALTRALEPAPEEDVDDGEEPTE